MQVLPISVNQTGEKYKEIMMLMMTKKDLILTI